ncbi:hypothetical protein F5I97DRAFT_1254130 [Phlebopus sp. FC_14]|nr:hypothetical protein F5I97DRAFT_1254130 [Phlebopus sp. FC_14]
MDRLALISSFVLTAGLTHDDGTSSRSFSRQRALVLSIQQTNEIAAVPTGTKLGGNATIIDHGVRTDRDDGPTQLVRSGLTGHFETPIKELFHWLLVLIDFHSTPSKRFVFAPLHVEGSCIGKSSFLFSTAVYCISA